MDSVTQFVLGAAVGEAALGKHLGRKAMLWGGLLGTVPDLDVFIPMGSAVADFTYHRSFSHSLFVLAALTPFFAWLGVRWHDNPALSWQRWAMAVYAIFATHVLLDSFTAYGTQIFWPFFTTPMTWSTLFIIDPLYTVPIIGGLMCLLLSRQPDWFGHKANWIGLVLSTVYLSFSVGAKLQAEQRFSTALAEQGIEVRGMFTTPAPFNTLLWRAVVMVDGGYYEGFYALLDGAVPLQFDFHASETQWLTQLEGESAVERLQWFSKGFYAVNQREDTVVISDLRMGALERYVFRFEVADLVDNAVVAKEPVLLEPHRSLAGMSLIWERIWDPTVELKL
jgi:inner membrane protein